MKGKANTGVGGVFLELLAFLVGVCLLMVPFLAWFTHVFVCFKTGAWGFLIAGALLFPLGIIHGLGIWFGFW